MSTCSFPNICSSVITRAYSGCYCAEVTVRHQNHLRCSLDIQKFCPSICPGRLLSNCRSISFAVVAPSHLDVPIALWKGKRSYTDHLLYNFISYDRFTPSFLQFVMFLSSISTPRSYKEALLEHAWKQTMDEEIDALISRETWELVYAPKNIVVGCQWVYTLKYHPDGSVDQYKARLDAKSYTQTYGMDYFETFHHLLGWTPWGFYFLLMSICHGHCSNWMSRIPSCMVI